MVSFWFNRTNFWLSLGLSSHSLEDAVGTLASGLNIGANLLLLISVLLLGGNGVGKRWTSLQGDVDLGLGHATRE